MQHRHREESDPAAHRHQEESDRATERQNQFIVQLLQQLESKQAGHANKDTSQQPSKMKSTGNYTSTASASTASEGSTASVSTVSTPSTPLTVSASTPSAPIGQDVKQLKRKGKEEKKQVKHTVIEKKKREDAPRPCYLCAERNFKPIVGVTIVPCRKRSQRRRRR